MTRRERRAAYERVLGIVEHNTDGKQPPTIDADHIMVHVDHSSVDNEQGRKALRAAIENGDLERIGDGYRVPD